MIARLTQLRSFIPIAAKISSMPVYEGWRTQRYRPFLCTACGGRIATLVLKDLPSEKMAVQQTARPATNRIMAAVLSQCAPPNMVRGCASAYHIESQIDPKITGNKSSKEPRSLICPLLRLVRVTT